MRSKIFVPGAGYCKQCSLHVGGNCGDSCPNGCGPLSPVTWEKHAKEAWELLDKYAAEIELLKQTIADLSEAKQCRPH